MIVSLFDQVGTALIIPFPTGIIYTNQAGGHACLQPKMEGFLAPIANEVSLDSEHRLDSPENQLFEYFRTRHSFGQPLSDCAASHIDSIFHNLPPWPDLAVDRSKLSDSFESWVHVSITKNDFGPLPVSSISYPVNAVLTWSNSD